MKTILAAALLALASLACTLLESDEGSLRQATDTWSRLSPVLLAQDSGLRTQGDAPLGIALTSPAAAKQMGSLLLETKVTEVKQPGAEEPVEPEEPVTAVPIVPAPPANEEVVPDADVGPDDVTVPEGTEAPEGQSPGRSSAAPGNAEGPDGVDSPDGSTDELPLGTGSVVGRGDSPEPTVPAAVPVPQEPTPPAIDSSPSTDAETPPSAGSPAGPDRPVHTATPVSTARDGEGPGPPAAGETSAPPEDSETLPSASGTGVSADSPPQTDPAARGDSAGGVGTRDMPDPPLCSQSQALLSCPSGQFIQSFVSSIFRQP